MLSSTHWQIAKYSFTGYPRQKFPNKENNHTKKDIYIKEIIAHQY
jgi:activator of 2-hydroxyglutaryl-CoA dehydratase